ncbi:MAG: KamA family radical SAM protein [Firmicutes bacterium]|nr:KamA family radical SAM protein [Bacillota bacterium]
MINSGISIIRKELFESLGEFPELLKIVTDCSSIEEARDNIYDLLNRIERELNDDLERKHPLDRINIMMAFSVIRNYISLRSEHLTGHSFLKTVFEGLKGNETILSEISRDFLLETCHLMKAAVGKADMYSPEDDWSGNIIDYRSLTGRDAAVARSRFLDNIAENAESHLKKYPSGLLEDVFNKRKENIKRILDIFGAGEDDWLDYKWHLRNIIRDSATLGKIVKLTDEEVKSIDLAREKHIPFGITPYYASLMDYESDRTYDHAVRAQVIPPMEYSEKFNSADRKEMDFMKESDTSPVDLVTRRYPMIAIFKPYNTCAQICVYCQRNWEIDDVYCPTALASQEQIDNAIDWFRENKSIKGILLTGGDPLIMTDDKIDEILGKLSEIPHIERIRIGTRTPVVLPFRFTDKLVDILKKYHVPGKREICIVTHFEHPYEVTPDAMNAVQKIKQVTSMNFYNQQVFTIENSRRFETVALRQSLKFIGIDPYYVFHAKGKKETEYYIVPIARLLQERKEEARLTPGVVRTDEPVYNIPGIGKNHLRALQDHELIMLTPGGNRLYEMHPWEKAIVIADTYIYEDVPIGSYLKRLEERGENLSDYRSVWYYY